MNIEAQLTKLAQVARDALNMEEVKAVLALSIDQLTPELRAAWHKLGVFEGSFSAEAATAVIDDESAEEILAALEQRHLLTLSDQQRLQLHDILCALAVESLPAEDRECAEYRHATHYNDLLTSAKELYKAGKVLEGLRLFDQERHQIQAGQRWAAERIGDSESIASLAVDYANAGVYILSLRFAPQQRIEWLEIQLDASQKLENRQGEGAALGNLGLAYHDLGEYRRAIEFYNQVLEIAREIGDQRSQGAALSNLGLAHDDLSEHNRAIEFYNQVLEIAREIGDQRSEGAALGNLGVAYKNLGEHERAIEFHERRLEIAREIGDRLGEGIAFGNLGFAYHNLGDTKRAIEFHKQSLDVSREIGDRRGEGQSLSGLGMAYNKLGDTKRAFEFYEQALDLSRKIGDRLGEGQDLGNLGHAYHDLGDTKRAISSVEAALSIFREIGEKHLVEQANRRLAQLKDGVAPD